MNTSNLSKEKDSNQKVKRLQLNVFQIIFIAAALLDLIFIILIVVYKNTSWSWYSPLLSILCSLMATFICTATISVYEKKKILDSNIPIDNILNDINNKLALQPTGVKNVCTENRFKEDNGFQNRYEISKNAISVLIHGHTHINDNKDVIASRFNKKGFVSKWFLLNPDSESLEMISKKTNSTKELIQERIKGSKDLLIQLYENSSQMGTLEIFYMSLLPMQAVYIFDDAIIECKYYSSIEKGPGNYILVYENNGNNKSIGHSFVDDCTRIEKESKCIFTSCYNKTDMQFKECLQGKTKISIVEWLDNKHDKLAFLSVNNNGMCIFEFGYRYYKNDVDFRRNKSFYYYQFRKEAENLQERDANIKLFFITGIGGKPNNPRAIIIYQYKYSIDSSKDEFVPNPEGCSIKELTLKSFGFNTESNTWK